MDEPVKPDTGVAGCDSPNNAKDPAHYSKAAKPDTPRVMVGGRLFEGLRPFVMADVEGRLDEIQAKVMDGCPLTPDELVIIAVAGKEVE